jgi:hypothetical protein
MLVFITAPRIPDGKKKKQQYIELEILKKMSSLDIEARGNS